MPAFIRIIGRGRLYLHLYTLHHHACFHQDHCRRYATGVEPDPVALTGLLFSLNPHLVNRYGLRPSADAWVYECWGSACQLGLLCEVGVLFYLYALLSSFQGHARVRLHTLTRDRGASHVHCLHQWCHPPRVCEQCRCGRLPPFGPRDNSGEDKGGPSVINRGCTRPAGCTSRRA